MNVSTDLYGFRNSDSASHSLARILTCVVDPACFPPVGNFVFTLVPSMLCVNSYFIASSTKKLCHLGLLSINLMP